MGTPILKLIFDRRKRASRTKEGAIELRITYNRIQKHATTGVRVLPKQWRNGHIVNRLDAYELQRTLDEYVTNARRVINNLMENGSLDMQTVVAEINGKQKQKAAKPAGIRLMDFFRERALIRKYGRAEDSQERYDRFLKWFEEWGGMLTMDDINEVNILHMDEALEKKGMKPYSKWNNYHRFLNSFILDAIDAGHIHRNPYRNLHIEKDKTSTGIDKFLTREEFNRIEQLQPPVNYLCHARDLFIFQTYTCLSYTDLAAFDPARITTRNGKRLYVGNRGKTRQEFTFLLLEPALDVLNANGGKLPMMSNVKYNAYLKVLAVMAKINKPISSHWARHTGATMLLNAGVNMEIVAKILGHSSTTITRRVYAKLLDDTIAREMEKMQDTKIVLL